MSALDSSQRSLLGVDCRVAVGPLQAVKYTAHVRRRTECAKMHLLAHACALDSKPASYTIAGVALCLAL